MKTPHMHCDMIADGFNGSTERQYWRASVGGTVNKPAVYFNSRSSMVIVIYRPDDGVFQLRFSRTACPFGDYLHSGDRALRQVLQAFKATGLDIACPLDEADGVMRLEFDPVTKEATVHIAKHGDDWLDTDPMSFKVLENNFDPSTISA
jgi:hypothetical protein